MVATLAYAILPSSAGDKGGLTKMVDPYIGTGGHGHTFLGANVPFGLVQLGPTEPVRGWDWCSGYNYADSVLVGFSHMHLSGTGIGDLGDIAFLPVAQPSQRSMIFSHRNESVAPGYYSLYLDQIGVLAELTATERCGMHRYTYTATHDRQQLLLDLDMGIGWDSTRDCMMRQCDASVCEGRWGGRATKSSISRRSFRNP